MPDENFQYSLMDEEIERFKKFIRQHHRCNPKKSEAMAEEDCVPVYHSVLLQQSTIGMWPTAICEICGTRENIGCKERSDFF